MEESTISSSAERFVGDRRLISKLAYMNQAMNDTGIPESESCPVLCHDAVFCSTILTGFYRYYEEDMHDRTRFSTPSLKTPSVPWEVTTRQQHQVMYCKLLSTIRYLVVD